MDKYLVPFSGTTTNSLIPNNSRTTSSSSNIISLAQQNMGELQNVNSAVDNSGQVGFPDPYYAPYDQNIQFQQVNQYPYNTFSIGQPNEIYGSPNSEVQGWSHPEEEEHRKSMGLTTKVARDKRKQVRQKNKSFGPMAPLAPTKGTKGIIREQLVPGEESVGKIAINQDRTINVFCSPNGKKLEEIFTKQLKNSDVSVLGRIVLPKREVEAKLPPLTDKEGKDIMLKDVHSGLIWTLKYKYWSNNRSRMYVLENAGELVNHYELQMGDFITIYEDEWKNLYVWARKKINLEPLVSFSNTESLHTNDSDNHSDKHTYDYAKQSMNEDACLDLFTKELNHKEEVEDAKNLLTSFNGSGSSSHGAKLDMNMAQHEELSNIVGKGAPRQTYAEATPVAPIIPNGGHNMSKSDEDVYGGLENIFEIENTFHSFGHLKDYNTWPYSNYDRNI